MFYEYEVRLGALDDDGIEDDIYVKRIGFGTNQPGDAAYEFIVGKHDAWQYSIARTWPKIDLDVVINDFNLDGLVDFWLQGIDEFVPDALDAIVFSGGQQGGVSSVTFVNDELVKVFSNIAGWLADPNYFDQYLTVEVTEVFVRFCQTDYDPYGFEFFNNADRGGVFLPTVFNCFYNTDYITTIEHDPEFVSPLALELTAELEDIIDAAGNIILDALDPEAIDVIEKLEEDIGDYCFWGCYSGWWHTGLGSDTWNSSSSI